MNTKVTIASQYCFVNRFNVSFGTEHRQQFWTVVENLKTDLASYLAHYVSVGGNKDLVPEIEDQVLREISLIAGVPVEHIPPKKMYYGPHPLRILVRRM